MARRSLGDQVQEQTTRVRKIIDGLVPLLDPIASVLMAQASEELDRIDRLCEARRPASPAALTAPVEAQTPRRTRTPKAASGEGSRKPQKRAVARQEA